MAPRLTRWSVAGGLGLVAVVVATLPPGPGILLGYPSYLDYTAAPGPAGIVAANEGALGAARDRLNVALRRQSLLALAPRTEAPVVVHFVHNEAVIDVAMTAAAESLWRAIPRAADAPRAVLIEADHGHAMRLDVWRDFPPDLCVAPFDSSRGPGKRTLRWTTGACAFATRFGPPGAAMRAWLDSTGPVAFPDVVIPQGGRGIVSAFASFGAMDDWHQAQSFAWFPSHEQEACAGGRLARCPDGLGFHEEGARRTDPPWERYNRRGGTSRVPAALLADLGPERFGQLWRGDEPVPVAYQRLSGRRFDQWAMSYVQDAIGRLDKENGLTALGWLGWALWMGIVLVWFAVRVERRSAT